MHTEINALIKGYKNFREQYFGGDDNTYAELQQNGQQPKVMIIACSDSRVDPAIVTNSSPGDLFVVRNVANLVPPFEDDNQSYHGTSAALEFAVCTLKVKHVIVFGHNHCGGIEASLEHARNKDHPHRGFINKWMEISAPATNMVLSQHDGLDKQSQINLCGQYALINSLMNLATFPFVKARMEEGLLQTHGWYFDLISGGINCFDKESSSFVKLEKMCR